MRTYMTTAKNVCQYLMQSEKGKCKIKQLYNKLLTLLLYQFLLNYIRRMPTTSMRKNRQSACLCLYARACVFQSGRENAKKCTQTRTIIYIKCSTISFIRNIILFRWLLSQRSLIHFRLSHFLLFRVHVTCVCIVYVMKFICSMNIR